jgi:excisionase family DNA binding protein
MSSEWLFVEDVARELRVPIGTVRYWIRARKLASARPGRRLLVLRQDLEAFVASSRTYAVFDVGARGLTNCGGNPGRLTPTADPSVEHGSDVPVRFKGGEDRPGVAGGEAHRAEGAKPTGPCPGLADSGERARSGGSA